MFKKFYIYLVLLSTIISFIFSFSKPYHIQYYYPIKDNDTISSYYGPRELFGKYNFHNGIDIATIVGNEVYSVQSGIVKYIGFDEYGYGNFIIVLHGNSYKSLYGHLSENTLVSIGKHVNAGQIIGLIGPKILSNGKSNGKTTGPHLHFSIYSSDGNSINPLSLKYIK